MAKKLVIEPNKPAKNGLTVSVSGWCQAFINVGIAANPSLNIAKIIATLGFLVIPQKN
jgi:hypothetical protein